MKNTSKTLLNKVMFVLSLMIVSLSYAQASFANCEREVGGYHPAWSGKDRYYVCSARRTMRPDANRGYTSCVIAEASRSDDGAGEAIIDACLGNSCVARVLANQPAWDSNDAYYVCSARRRIAPDSNARYTECVIAASAASDSGAGETIIDSCL